MYAPLDQYRDLPSSMTVTLVVKEHTLPLLDKIVSADTDIPIITPHEHKLDTTGLFVHQTFATVIIMIRRLGHVSVFDLRTVADSVLHTRQSFSKAQRSLRQRWPVRVQGHKPWKVEGVAPALDTCDGACLLLGWRGLGLGTGVPPLEPLLDWNS